MLLRGHEDRDARGCGDCDLDPQRRRGTCFVLCVCYAISGTDLWYGAMQSSALKHGTNLSSYAISGTDLRRVVTTRWCLQVTLAMCLRTQCAIPSTDTAHGVAIRG
eukprot:1814880-Rhodomonas_salina.2